jgi:hypothetical protein
LVGRWYIRKAKFAEDYLSEVIIRLPEPQPLPSIAAPQQRNRLAFGQSKKNCGSAKELVAKET